MLGKKLLNIIAAIMFLVGIAVASAVFSFEEAFAADHGLVVSEGTVGNCAATLYSDNTLVLASGTISISEGSHSVQWSGIDKTAVKSVEISEGANVAAEGSIDACFEGCTQLEDVSGLASLDTSQATSAMGLFSGCSALKDVSVIRQWNKEHIIGFCGAFSGCAALKEIDFSNCDFSGVTVLGSFFSGVPNLETLKLNNCDFSGVTSSQVFISGCPKLKTIEMRNCNFSNISNSSSAFIDRTLAEGATLDMSGCDFSSIVQGTGFFYSPNIAYINLHGANFSKMTTTTGTFMADTGLKTLDMSDADFSSLTDANGMMLNVGIESLDLSGAKMGSLVSSPSMAPQATTLKWLKTSSSSRLFGLGEHEASGDYLSTWKTLDSSVRGKTAAEMLELINAGNGTGTWVWEQVPSADSLQETIAAISYAAVSEDGTDIPSNRQWTPASVKNTLDAAVTDIRSAISAGGTADWAQLQEGLYTALDAYNAAKQPGTGALSIDFVHTMKTSAAVNLAGITYTYTLAPTTLDSSLRTTGVRDVPTAVSTNLASASIALDSASPLAGSTEWTKSFQTSKTLNTLFGDADDFGAPGIFIFDVAETASGGSAASGVWTAGGETYRIRIGVINGEGNHLKYSWWTAESLSTHVKADTLSFSSAYNAWQPLTITKQVEGDYANKNYEFPFEVTFYLPEWYDASSRAVATPSGASVKSAFAQDGGNGAYIGSYTVSLHHGESVSFTVPVGTRYKVDEFAGSAAKTDDVGVEYSPEIEWTVSPNPLFAPPSVQVDSLSDYTMPQLQAISDDIRAAATAGDITQSDYYAPMLARAQAGEALTATLGDGTSKTVRLVDVSGRGLTFMTHTLSFQPISDRGEWSQTGGNGIAQGGWPASKLRGQLNEGGDLYEKYLAGMTMQDGAVVPLPTVVYSYKGSEGPSVSSEDLFWLASISEVCGSFPGHPERETECSQFAYFGSDGLGVTTENTTTTLNGQDSYGMPAAPFPLASGEAWWTRSTIADGTASPNWQVVGGNGHVWGYEYPSASKAILVCFNI